ncbi:MAG: hypothetical protein KAT35_04605 [Candidatus Aenigmarchaeota archaeon]|nr:hypothetical protein [Candidatus Aenigmarchaeota archaeon]
MYRQKKTPTDPCNARFVESYDSGMRKNIGGWRDEGYSFSRISRLLLPLGFDVSAYYIEKTTKSYDTRVLEETGSIKESMIFLKERGISEREIKRRLHEEGIDADIKSIVYSLKKWRTDDTAGEKNTAKSSGRPKTRKSYSVSPDLTDMFPGVVNVRGTKNYS